MMLIDTIGKCAIYRISKTLETTSKIKSVEWVPICFISDI